MTRSRTAGRTRHRAGHALLAIGLGTALTAAPFVALTTTASAAEADEVTADSGDLAWGFRESFRNYVGRQTAALPPIGAVPIGERITLVAPGQFDEAGTPAANLDTTPPNETLPYLLPVSGGTVTDADNLTVDSTGGAVYHFPSHAFTVTVKDISVVVDGGVGSLVGDLAVVIPENNLGYEPGTYGGDDVVLGEVATTTVDVSADAVTVTGTGVTLTAEGAAALQGFLAEGAALDNFTVSAQTTTPAGGSADEIDLEVTVPEDDGDPEPGAFTWTVVGGAGAVSLGTAEAGTDALTATGDLKQVTVSDTRAGGPAWSINGTATDFFASGGSASFPGSSLGWSPSVTENTGGAVAGPLVRPSTGSGLTAGATLVSAPAGHAAGSVTADAALDLRIPLDTPAGDYTSVLTLTAVG